MPIGPITKPSRPAPSARGLLRFHWAWWLAGALIGAAAQVDWLVAHGWSQVYVRLPGGAILGAVVLGPVLGLAARHGKAVLGKAGFRKVTRCSVDSLSDVVGEIPDWDPLELDFVNKKEVYNWNAAYVILTMAVCKEALERSGLNALQHQGVAFVFVLGNPSYYGRFGFETERHVMPPYPLVPAWTEAWQSLVLAPEAPHQARPAGLLRLPAPWLMPQLWTP